ncbi:MAG: mechanosensitive ion channel, partial [Gammaproteobacteria bacterium]|nr:mechanosensitive ion channel [Gammaproteobacteria bacterium]
RPSGEQTAQLAEAGRWAAQTRLESLQTEIAMLDQELLSYTVRNDLLRAQRDESALSLSRINERVDALREIITERRRLENERAMAQAQAALEGELANEPLVRELAQANLALVLRLQGQLAELDSLAARERSRPRVVQIEGAFRSARRKLDLVGTGAPVGLAVLRERRQFPSAREYAVERRVIGRSTTAVSLRLVETEEERRMLNDVTVYVDGRIAEAGAEPMSAEAGIALKNLAESRRSLLERAIANDNALQQRLYALDDAMQRLGDRTNSYDDYLSERLLWVRSTRPIDTSALTQLPRQVARYLAPAQWLDVARFATQRLIEAPAFLLILLAGFALAWRRKQLRNGLLECGSVVGRIRQDTMTKTIEALGYTLLLAAPVPLILAAVGGGLATAPEGPDFPNSVGLALLLTAAWLSLPITIRVLFGAGGVAERHFGWDGPTLKRIGQQLDWFLIVAFPAYFVTLTATTVESQTGAAIHGLTMFAFVILMASLVALVVGLAHPRTGPVQKLLAAQTGSRWWRWRSLWFSFLILTPIGLLALALFGFTYTAEELTRRLFQSIWFLIAVGLGAALVRRWLLLTGRRLAFQAAKTAREAARLRALADSGAEPMIEADVAAPEVDLVALGADSRQLLNATTLVVAALGLAGIWGTVIPALGILDEYSLWSRTALVDGVNQLVPVTLATLLLALVVVVGSYVLATNLPSLLDIILLKQGSVSAGGRYTIATLTRYTVTAISVLLVLRLLGVNASQLGWAAAALGVGIGFGLQEIVANFICGLILLFERPIRVGDTITVGEASGTVTQIRIRATTIRDWDQKELVVPNKELITGRLLNWSLSDSVTRLSITVGVAYGSDVDRAMDLIREAADENDHVVDDPSPSVHFERFADSSLNLTLRAFVGQLSERLQTITELHKAIDKKFREAGIVIAFPQRDLHIYTSDQSAPAPGPAGLQEVKGTAGR